MPPVFPSHRLAFGRRLLARLVLARAGLSLGALGGPGSRSRRACPRAAVRIASCVGVACLVVAGAAATPGVSEASADPGLTGPIERVSVAGDGAQANSGSGWMALSGDGRYVAFTSDGSNLVAGDTNGKSDVFVRDRHTGAIERVSVATGGAQATGYSGSPQISADGRYVAFISDASNLVAGDTNGRVDVFVRDRHTGVTERVSVATGGAQATGYSGSPQISADGRYVAFTSGASDLVAGHGNGEDVFVRDRRAGTTERVSVTTAGEQGDSWSDGVAISADGRYVAFASWASNLVAGDTNLHRDVFVRDRVAGTTERVSVAGGGEQGNFDSFGNDLGLAISADGRFVAFVSEASNLVAGDTNGSWDLFVRDRLAGTTERVNVSSAGEQTDNSEFSGFAISADGRYAAWASWASNLVAGDANGEADVFVRDRRAGTTQRVSVNAAGQEGDSGGYVPAISADGRYVAFSSGASNLVAGDTNRTSDVFVRALGPLAPCTGAGYAGAVRCDESGSYWRLDGRAGSVAADAAGGAPATYHGGRLGQPGPVAGGALGLNLHARAQGEHVDAGDVHDFAGRRPFSLEAWVKPRDLGAQTARIVSKEDGGAGYLLGVDAGGVAFSRYARGSAQTVRAPLGAGRWTYVVATYDGDRMRLFLDGREAAVRPSAAELPDHRGPLVLGAKSGRWRFFAGWLDEVAIYPVALDAATVGRHFERATGG